MLATLTVLLPALAPVQEAGAAPGFDQRALQAKVDEISPRVAKLRDREFKQPVPAGVQTPEEFLVFAAASMEKDYGRDTLQAMSDVYELLGLIEPGTSLGKVMMDLLKEQVGGYYDPETKKFYMISTFNKGGLADVIMAHELCHALDDQYYDLQGMIDEAIDMSSDAEFAMRAVVEGSGTSLMNLYLFEGMLKGYLEIDMAEMSEMMEAQVQSLDEAPPYLIMSLALPYLEGNKFLAREPNMMKAAMAAPKGSDLDHAFREPPLSSEQVLHLEKYWDESRRDDPAVLKLPDFSPKLGPGWTLVKEDVLGELACFVVTDEQGLNLMDAATQLSGSWFNQASSGWDGDLAQLYRGPDGERLLVWALVWDAPQDRQEFLQAYRKLAENYVYFRGHHDGGDAAVLYFSDERAAGQVEILRQAVAQARPDWRSEG